MTPQEQQLLQDLTQKINQTVLPDKDPEAEQFLMSSLSRNPDAVYILAQTGAGAELRTDSGAAADCAVEAAARGSGGSSETRQFPW